MLRFRNICVKEQIANIDNIYLNSNFHTVFHFKDATFHFSVNGVCSFLNVDSNTWNPQILLFFTEFHNTSLFNENQVLIVEV